MAGTHTRFSNVLPLLFLLSHALQAVRAWAANALAGNPSPYLAIHGQDPVDWSLWCPGALAEARAKNRLLFLFSGYFACHLVSCDAALELPRSGDRPNGSTGISSL